MEKEKSLKLTLGLFGIYFLALIWIILFKMQFSLDTLDGHRSLNLIPFAGSMIVNGRVEISEILNNLLIFIPFGIYLGMLKPRWPFLKKILPFFLTSLLLETLQYILAIGATDITDLIVNTLGGMTGIFIYFCFAKLFREKALKILNMLAFVCTAAMLVFITLVLIL